MVRANEDGKASFYGTIVTAVNQLILLGLLLVDRDFVMTIPKVLWFCVAAIILYGIVQNSDGKIGI